MNPQQHNQLQVPSARPFPHSDATAELARKNQQLRTLRGPAHSSGPDTSEKSRRKAFALRWGYLVPRLTAACLCWALIAFGFEPLLHWSITSSTGAALGTTVGIDRLESGFFNTHLNLERVQIASKDEPGVNAVEIAAINVELNRDALLRKKFVIDYATINDVRVNTASSLDFSSTSVDGEEWSFPFRTQVGVLSEFARGAADSFFDTLLSKVIDAYNPNQLETVQLAEQKKHFWQDRFNAYRQQSESLKRNIESLKTEFETIKKSNNPLEQLERSARLARQVDALIAESKRLKEEFMMLPQQARVDLQELEAAKERDVASIRSQIDAIPLNADELTAAIVGPQAKQQFEELASWLGFVQRCVAVATEDYEPERQTGRTIDFDTAGDIPRFLLRRLDINGMANLNEREAIFSGQLCNVTSAARHYPQPLTYHFELSHEGHYMIDGQCDFSQSPPVFDLVGHMTTDHVPVHTIASHEKLKLNAHTGHLIADLRFRLAGDEIQSTVNWRQQDVRFDVDSSLKVQPTLLAERGIKPFAPVELLTTALDAVNHVEGEIRLSGSIRSPRIEMQSDVGRHIVAGLQQGFQRELQLRKIEFTQLAQSEIERQTQSLTNEIDGKYQQLLSELRVNETLASGLLDRVAVRPAGGVLKSIFR
ncbi:hypothetical protein [Rubinisphaera margarita]|uniref:hypothetical protein n=1 Tax=Rubinisphaera margarita TaxID=2909586 RepID=UPI001EE94D1A|nr:hypothetical protein [Rubinisphaera margarita]MCG6156141.1 hypothetical protein [Rubinisphaera margarita]